jgi:hypothetical protein
VRDNQYCPQTRRCETQCGECADKQQAYEAGLTRPNAWISLADRQPEHDIICLVSDGHDIALCVADMNLWPGRAFFDPCGCTGHDLEMTFEPTHWMPMSISLP